MLEIIEKNLNRKIQPIPDINKNLIKETVDYLLSEEAVSSIEKDPYWPKWDTPWWQIAILFEIGLSSIIPGKIIKIMADKINSHYLKFFPFVEAEIPEGIDPVTQIICHCQLGTIDKIFYSLNITGQLDWARDWFIKYQLPDGGLNCDEAVYTNTKHSSLVSTLPCLETILLRENLNASEKQFLDNGAEYILSKRIFQKSSGEIINENWLKPFFPRFYEYDILRALNFLTKWALQYHKSLPVEAISETVEIIDNLIGDDNILNSAPIYFLGKANRFTLLNEFVDNNAGNKYLTAEWYETILNLSLLQQQGQLIITK